MSTKTLEQQEVKERKENLKNIVLFNDDVNTFDHVINLLVKVCNHDTIQAEQCATLVHYKGKCAVKSGSLDELKVISEILSDNGLTVEIN